MVAEIIDYEDCHADAFRTLNLAWIERWFTVEAADRASLGDPRGKILDAGGAILLARLQDEIVATTALIPLDTHLVELAKMAVAEPLRGRGIGLQIGAAGLARARNMGFGRIYLETNTILGPALGLYRRLGFVPFDGPPSPYARCNVQMVRNL